MPRWLILVSAFLAFGLSFALFKSYGDARYDAGKADCQAKYAEVEVLTVVERVRDRGEIDNAIKKISDIDVVNALDSDDWLYD